MAAKVKKKEEYVPPPPAIPEKKSYEFHPEIKQQLAQLQKEYENHIDSAKRAEALRNGIVRALATSNGLGINIEVAADFSKMTER
jgi:hypothetical protein